jgi:hypothetical protein
MPPAVIDAPEPAVKRPMPPPDCGWIAALGGWISALPILGKQFSRRAGANGLSIRLWGRAGGWGTAATQGKGIRRHVSFAHSWWSPRSDAHSPFRDPTAMCSPPTTSADRVDGLAPSTTGKWHKKRPGGRGSSGRRRAPGHPPRVSPVSAPQPFRGLALLALELIEDSDRRRGRLGVVFTRRFREAPAVARVELYRGSPARDALHGRAGVEHRFRADTAVEHGPCPLP